MARSRTVKSLAALVMAMTLGTFALMLLELKAGPLRPHDNLAAAAGAADELDAVILRTGVPVQAIKWRNVIVHSSFDADGPLARGCHFIVRQSADNGGSYVEATDWWRRQEEGRHAYASGYDYDRNSVGVCLIGDFSVTQPSREQFDAAVALVRSLQKRCQISAANVYLARQLPLRDKTPGAAFPIGYFDESIRLPPR